MKTPHKHAKLIKAWADGAEIEWLQLHNHLWMTCNSTPSWNDETEYRIKPETKPDVVVYGYIGKCDLSSPIELGLFPSCFYLNNVDNLSNLKLTFSTETKKLIKAEVI